MRKIGLKSTPSVDSLEIQIDPPKVATQNQSTVTGLATKSNKAKPAPRRTVFEPASGDVNATHLNETVALLQKELPPLPANAPTQVIKARNNVVFRLTLISNNATNAVGRPPEQVGRLLYQGWKNAAQEAAELSKALAPIDANAAAQCQITAAIYDELKRKHLSGAAQHIRDEWAHREAKNLEQVAPGIDQRRSGALVTTTTGGGLGWGPGAPGLDFDVGVAANTNYLAFVDEQRFAFLQRYLSGQGDAALLADLPDSWRATLRGRVGTNYVGNDVIGTRMVGAAELADVIKLLNDVECGSARHVSGDTSRQTASTNTKKVINAFKKSVMGMNYASAPGAPMYLSQPKLAKGFVSTNLGVLVEALQAQRKKAGQDEGSIGTLLEQHYPSMHQGIADSLDSDRELPKFGIHNSVPKDAFFGYAYGPLVGVKAAFGKSEDSASLAARGVSLSFGVEWDTLEFPNWLPHQAHQALDFNFAKDACETMHVHGKLDHLLSANAPDPKPQMLHLYAALSRELGGTPPPLPPDGLSASDRKYYQGLDNRQIPDQFLDGILHPSVDKLDKAAAAAHALGQMRHDFVRHADALMSRPSKYWSKPLKQELNHRRSEAFDVMNAQVWGGAYPGGKDAALKDPEKFIGQTNGALSLAFGVAGTHLSIQKRQLDAAGMDDQQKAAVVNADTIYKQARTLFDHDNLNISVQKLGHGKNTPLHVFQTFRRHTAAATASVTGGFQGNLLEGAVSAGGSSTQGIQAGPSTGVSVNVATKLGTGSVTAKVKWQNMNLQDSPGRQGFYVQTEFTATAGGPLTVEALDLLSKQLMKLGTGVKQDRDKVNPINLLHGLAAAGLLQVDEGKKLVVRFRQAPTTEGYELEYIRPVTVRAHGSSVSASIKTPGGTFKPSLSATAFAESPDHEIRGPDVYYLMAQHSGLKEVLAEVKDDKTLAQVFAAHPECCSAYFGLGTTIPTVIDRYLKAMSDDDQVAQKDRNEFHRYFKDPHFKRLSEVAKDVASHAPGSRAGETGQFTAPAPLSEPITLPTGIDWATVKTAINAMPNANARAAWYASDAGRPVFNTFVAIMDAVAGVDAAASLHHTERTFGFYSKLAPDFDKRAKATRRADQGKRPTVMEIFKQKLSTPAATPASFGKLPDEGPLSVAFAGKADSGAPKVWDPEVGGSGTNNEELTTTSLSSSDGKPGSEPKKEDEELTLKDWAKDPIFEPHPAKAKKKAQDTSSSADADGPIQSPKLKEKTTTSESPQSLIDKEKFSTLPRIAQPRNEDVTSRRSNTDEVGTPQTEESLPSLPELLRELNLMAEADAWERRTSIQFETRRPRKKPLRTQTLPARTKTSTGNDTGSSNTQQQPAKSGPLTPQPTVLAESSAQSAATPPVQPQPSASTAQQQPSSSTQAPPTTAPETSQGGLLAPITEVSDFSEVLDLLEKNLPSSSKKE